VQGFQGVSGYSGFQASTTNLNIFDAFLLMGG
jgi:hypothetical protein